MLVESTRRQALKTMLLAGAAAAIPSGVAGAVPRAAAPDAPVRWIDGAAPALDLGQTFGVPWPRGSLRPGQPLAMRDDKGVAVPSQSWPLATWPDGSVKWTAHALPAGASAAGYVVGPGRGPAAAAAGISVSEDAGVVRIRNGAVTWEIPRSGNALIRGALVGEQPVLGPVELVAAARPDLEGAPASFTGRVDRVVIEQRGPVRAVVKIEGMHAGGGRSWLPFSVRLYAYAGSSALRIVHSFVYDGDPAKDFVSALGLRAAVPMRGDPVDRHVRLALDEGRVFTEAVRPLTGLRRDPGAAFRNAQVAGHAVPPLATMARGITLERIPAWGEFTLAQLSADGFEITKRTRPGQGAITAAAGKRAAGLGYVGSPSGGAALAMRYFWERHPTQIDVKGADTDTATLTAWMWSPEAPAMDLRAYHDTMGMEGYDAQNQGLDTTYEDYEPGWDSATGIARTSELTLWACAATPETATLAQMAAANATPPRLMTEPARIHAAGVLGIWGLPDRSTPMRARVEDQLANLIDFYEGEVDRRHWYGFWNHGDVMHSYDADRHQWRYDIGGFAWANSELSPDLWLWYAALRTGDPRTFRFAEAMTRHTGEVDVYHLGRFAGLGTRHGVQHFSDSSKQPRVSNANYRRIFYYLTADERVGDLLSALVTSDQALATVEIGRKVPGKDKTPPPPPGTVEMTFGTTWCPLAAAWFTEWERTGDRKWRDRILAGMDSIGRMKKGWMTGSAPFDFHTGRFVDPGDHISLSHLNAVFGAVEISDELLHNLESPGYRKAWLDYCRWYNAPRAEYLARFGEPFGPRNLRQGHSRLTAWAAHELGDAALAKRAAEEFLSGQDGLPLAKGDPRQKPAGSGVPPGTIEWPRVSTNASAQWGLAAIQTLALVPEALDAGPDSSPRSGQGREPALTG